jgi:protein-S-isoprenylcysteine O-methyltransferase Ste14
MKATSFEFRFRIWFAVAFYALGFWAPWMSLYARTAAAAPTTTWLALSVWLARVHVLPLDQATLLVTTLAIVFGCAGAATRVWGAAYLGSSIVHSGAMHGNAVMAGGPYRFVRNPLYLGTWMFSLGISILMPPSGAIFFLAANAIFYLRLILGEEAWLAQRLGEPYQEYRRLVPRFVPRLISSPARSRIAAPVVRPSWLGSLLGECFPVGMSLCLAVLAWRYQPELLIRCLLVCFGLSLVARALLPKSQTPAAKDERLDANR